MTNLNTIVYHVSERDGSFIPNSHIPNVQDVYDQIVAVNHGKYAEILLIPEYNGNEVYEDVLLWVANNFGGPTGIPVMLTVFEGGPYSDHIVIQYTDEQIEAFMAVCNLQWVRIFEVCSWYIAHDPGNFPTSYVSNLLAFCETNNLKVWWTEYKVDHVFEDIAGYIAGYEDVVTVGFSTNSAEYEPLEGWNHIAPLFTHWGGSVQSWYWETRHRLAGLEDVNDPQNMPVSWMVQHSCLLRDMGGEVIQFEPYWYFFGYDDGKARDSLKIVHQYLNNLSLKAMDTNIVILETIFAEWMHGQEKDEIKWLVGRAESGWDIQPSVFDFKKMHEKYAVTCYNLDASSPSPRMWIKKEAVAVECLVKMLGITPEKAIRILDGVRAEVERIIQMYDLSAPLWDADYTYANGAPRRRRIPGIKDVMISRKSNPSDSSLARAVIQVTCKICS